MPASLMDKKGRKAPPSQYSVEIRSFSLLSKASVQNYVSEEFEAGGYKWSLSIYPTGNKKAGGQDHVSIYLVLRDTGLLPVGYEVNAIVNFSVYNFLEDEYVTTHDASVRRFHVLKTEWGVPKFIDLDTFNKPSKGYLIDDTCVFGAEIFIVKATNKGDCLSMIYKTVNVFHSWKFDSFSSRYSNMYESLPFVAGGYEWRIQLYPNGILEGNGNSISLFLGLNISTLPPNTKLLVDYTLYTKDQISGQHAQTTSPAAGIKFSKSNSSWGSRKLVSLVEFKDPKSGFLVGDSCIFEAEVKVLGLITNLN